MARTMGRYGEMRQNIGFVTMKNNFQYFGFVYCRREGAREISEKPLALKTIVIPACKKLFSTRTQNEF